MKGGFGWSGCWLRGGLRSDGFVTRRYGDRNRLMVKDDAFATVFKTRRNGDANCRLGLGGFCIFQTKLAPPHNKSRLAKKGALLLEKPALIRILEPVF